jgi:peroxiredoxin
MIPAWRVTQRAAFVLDGDNVLHYVEYMDKIGDEINFEAILNKVRELLA